MFAHTQRQCYVDDSQLDRSFLEVINPTIFESDGSFNHTVCAFYELFYKFTTDKVISTLGKELHSLYKEQLVLRFSAIADVMKEQMRQLHDNTIKQLKDACLELAREIDEEARHFLAVNPLNATLDAAVKATASVFAYNDKARLKRDRELRAIVPLRPAAAPEVVSEPSDILPDNQVVSTNLQTSTKTRSRSLKSVHAAIPIKVRHPKPRSLLK